MSVSDRIAPTHFSARENPWFCLLASIVLVLQVLALGSACYHSQLSSDDLYAYVFSQDAIHGVFPLSGWTLSSAPYFFPDLAVYASLLALTGLQGASIPIYAAGAAVGLGGLIGWFLKSLDASTPAPYWRGLLTVNFLFALSWLPNNQRWIWWAFVPNFHGGGILLAVAIAALVARCLRHRRGSADQVALILLLWLGMLSDSFTIIQTAVPLGVVIIWTTDSRHERTTALRRYGFALGVAFGLLVATKLALAFGQVFFAAKIFRYAPTPAHIFETSRLFWRDLWGERLSMTLLMIGSGLTVAFVALWLVNGKLRLSSANTFVARFVTSWALVGSVLVVTAVIGMGYWHDVSNARYLLTPEIFPLIAVAALMPIFFGGFSTQALSVFRASLCVMLIAVAVFSVTQISSDKLVFPYPNDIAQLDTFLSSRHLRRGLADYWTVHRYNVLGRAGVRLSALRSAANSTYPASVARFWNNNVFTFLDRDPVSGRWRRPEYTFIVTNGLDEPSLHARYGEPREYCVAGEWKIWILADPQAVSRLVVEDAEAQLKGRRWAEVAGDLH